MKRVGVFSGSFNPVHVGHLGFALQAQQAAELDEIYFLPERQPRQTSGVEHFGHRVAMLKQAIRPYAKFGILELHDVNFTVENTLPRLQHRFKSKQLIFLMGSDVAERLPSWPKVDKLLSDSELVVGVRHGQTIKDTKQKIESWPVAPRATYIFKSYAPHVSSTEVREGLLERDIKPGTLKSVQKYSDKHWLYVSFASKGH